MYNLEYMFIPWSMWKKV